MQAECRRLLQELLRAPQLQASTISAAYQSSTAHVSTALLHRGCVHRAFMLDLPGNAECYSGMFLASIAGAGWLRGASEGSGSLPTASGTHTFSFDVQVSTRPYALILHHICQPRSATRRGNGIAGRSARCSSALCALLTRTSGSCGAGFAIMTAWSLLRRHVEAGCW